LLSKLLVIVLGNGLFAEFEVMLFVPAVDPLEKSQGRGVPGIAKQYVLVKVKS